MSDEKEQTLYDISQYERMSAEELSTILRKDSEGSMELDSETILYIMRLYAAKRPDRPEKTAEEAFAAFRRDYLPRVHEPSVWAEEAVIPSGGKRRSKPGLWRPLSAAAAVVAVVLCAGLCVHSLMPRTWQPVYHQDRDHLFIAASYVSVAEEQLYEIAQRCFPQWIPEGYEQVQTQWNDDSYVVYYYISTGGAESYLRINFRAFSTSGQMEFLKDPPAAETFTHDDVHFYLYTNAGKNCVVGCFEGIVFTVSSQLPSEELIQIIRSMQIR